ncbi:EAL domain-containing protein [Rhizobacter sp. Root404]|uniref:EAL domain-containing protein n=1 Tax=Rhizobacter sp. Root404 TaxID=1736528 RepID=UPI0012FB586A
MRKWRCSKPSGSCARTSATARHWTASRPIRWHCCDFAHALRLRALSLVYQPKVATATGRLVGVEALARWKHPVKGVVSPSEFVPLAETTELIHPFTEFVLRSALAQGRDWAGAGTASRWPSTSASTT